MATTTNPPASDRLTAEETRAWRGLLRVHAAMSKALDAELESEHGLALTSYEVLMHLADAEDQGMRMCDLADGVLLSRSGLTRLVDRLVRDGYLVRHACSDDARGAFARLTPAGRAKLADARRTHLAGVRRMFLEHFSAADLDALAEFWSRLAPTPKT
jgi:DNA-binding MarR family transcriptional regulator